jgi:hypothetical protein
MFVKFYRRVLLVVCVLLTVAPASADIHIDDIKVSKAGGDFNMRVQISNIGSQGEKGPIEAELFIKGKFQDEWHHLKSWENIPGLPSGHRTSRDFFISQNDHPALVHGFVLKAIVHPANGNSVEGLRSFGPGMWD